MTDLSARNEKKFPVRTAVISVLVGISLLMSLLFILSPEASSSKFTTGKSLISPKGIGDGLNESIAPDEPSGPKVNRYDFRLSGHNTFYQIMSVLNVPGAEIHEIARLARPVFDLRQLRKGSILRVFTVDDKLQKIEYKFSDYEFLLIERSADGVIKASKSELPHEVRETVVTGTIENSLYEDGVKAGAEPQALMSLTDIFAWDIDFASDIKKGDSFSLISEVLYVEGVPVKSGRVLGAEMVNGGKKYTAFYYEGREGGSYYDSEGKSLSRTLLKSPLRFRRVTSYFSKGRFHPILKRYRPHHGIDYAAPVGTPIEAAGSGIVKHAGWKGGYGNYIEIKHSNGYSTAYGHLSRIRKGLRSGAKITQGDVIGYVGSTGISTGPHLHYEVKAGGRLINPLSIKAVADKAISKKEKAQFAALRDGIRQKLSGSDTAVAYNSAKR